MMSAYSGTGTILGIGDTAMHKRGEKFCLYILMVGGNNKQGKYVKYII